MASRQSLRIRGKAGKDASAASSSPTSAGHEPKARGKSPQAERGGHAGQSNGQASRKKGSGYLTPQGTQSVAHSESGFSDNYTTQPNTVEEAQKQYVH